MAQINFQKLVATLISVQIFAKVVTTTLNFLVARIVDKQVYGYANIQLQLYHSLILFFSKEAVRKACQRKIDGDETQALQLASAHNLVLMATPIQLLLSITVFAVITQLQGQEHSFENYNLAISVACLAAFAENLSETYFIRMLITGDMQPRMKVECLAISLKSLSTYFMLTQGLDLMAYALSQLLYSVTLLMLYPMLGDGSKQKSGLLQLMPLPKSKNRKPKQKHLPIEKGLFWVSDDTLRAHICEDHLLYLQDFSLTIVLKFFLTEGEKLLIIGTAAFDSIVQAEFSLVANLIGIVCRFIFQPAEESSSILFSSKQTSDLGSLSTYMQVMVAIGTGAVIFSKTCGMQFLQIVYSQKWATQNCFDLLQAYCLYCYFMAFNGLPEAYVFAKGDQYTLRILRRAMIMNSVLFVALSYLLSRAVGIKGLVLANCVNMLIRSKTCMYFAVKHEHRERTKSEMGMLEGIAAAMLFYLRVHSGKIYLGLTALAVVACLILQRFVIPLLMQRLGLDVFE